MNEHRQPRLCAVFRGTAVVAQELWLDTPVPPPHPEEARQVERAIARRKTEYAAGRHLARKALARLGIDGFVLLNGADRAPIWPDRILGAITHTGAAPDGYCAVATAPRDRVAALGIDAELTQPLEEGLWRIVLTAGERESLARQRREEQGLLAKVMFSAKESAYKAQYPLSGRMLAFHDITVELDPPSGQFRAQVRIGRAGGESLPGRGSWAGRYSVDPKIIVTAVAPAAPGETGAFCES